MQPGWYPDPDDASSRRYWDGVTWSAPLPYGEPERRPRPGPGQGYAPPTDTGYQLEPPYGPTPDYGNYATPEYGPTPTGGFTPGYGPPPGFGMPPGYSPEPTRRGRPTLLLVLGAVVVLAGAAVGILFATGVLGGSSAPPRFTVTGSMELTDYDGSISTEGDSCYGLGGYSDIRQGANVDITDENGRTLELAELEPGTSVGDTECTFEWTAEVEPGHRAYGVEVTHRGIVKFTEQQMREGPVTTLGDD